MLFWNQAVEIVRESIFAYAQACNGNLGGGILLVTFLARLALLPVGMRLARIAAQQQRAMARLPPAPGEGVSPRSLAGGLGTLAQAAVVVALYSGVRQAAAVGGRFLWIRTLASPDWPLALAATALTLLATATGAVTPSQSRALTLIITAAVSMVVLSKMAAGVGLYWALSSLFGTVQGWLVQRSLRSSAA
jgi:membrane protein insertase Oxa1/YidC/SpoIIIJ